MPLEKKMTREIKFEKVSNGGNDQETMIWDIEKKDGEKRNFVLTTLYSSRWHDHSQLFHILSLSW